MQAPTLGPELPTDSLEASSLLKPQLHSTQILTSKLANLASEQFQRQDALPAAESSAADEAAKHLAPLGGYTDLINVTDDIIDGHSQ
eukprot:scaffold54696_cov38-Prasinocladus_malaysianus.AAC.1